jgi:hypothetical protein
MAMREAWAIDNEHGSWLLRLGDRVTFLDDVDRLGRRTASIGILKDPPRLDRNKAISHIKVWSSRPGQSGLRPLLVPARSVIWVATRQRTPSRRIGSDR